MENELRKALEYLLDNILEDIPESSMSKHLYSAVDQTVLLLNQMDGIE